MNSSGLRDRAFPRLINSSLMRRIVTGGNADQSAEAFKWLLTWRASPARASASTRRWPAASFAYTPAGASAPLGGPGAQDPDKELPTDASVPRRPGRASRLFGSLPQAPFASSTDPRNLRFAILHLPSHSPPLKIPSPARSRALKAARARPQ